MPAWFSGTDRDAVHRAAAEFGHLRANGVAEVVAIAHRSLQCVDSPKMHVPVLESKEKMVTCVFTMPHFKTERVICEVLETGGRVRVGVYIGGLREDIL